MKLRVFMTMLAVGLGIGAVVDSDLHQYGPLPMAWVAPADPVAPFVASLEFPDGSSLFSGNGFLVEPNGLLLTNYHVARSGTTALAWMNGEWCIADRIPGAEWPVDDLALMRITCLEGVHVALPSYSAATSEFEPLVMLSRVVRRRDDGSPALYLSNLTGAIVIAVHEQMRAQLNSRLDIDDPLLPGRETFMDYTVVFLLGPSNEEAYLGLSGSPVVSLEGDVVGIFSKILGQQGFIVPMGKAKRRIAEWHMKRQRTAD